MRNSSALFTFTTGRVINFSCGAYSYGGIGAEEAQRALAAPIENTVFFAGEATDISGNTGTVHGALASGIRAAQEIRHDFH